MPKTTRTSISVPVELRRKMAAVKVPVNWSALACRAFKRKLAEIPPPSNDDVRRAYMFKDVNINDVVARLRASKGVGSCGTAGDDYAKGMKNGRSWAIHRAESFELESLERFHDNLPVTDKAGFFDDSGERSSSEIGEDVYLLGICGMGHDGYETSRSEILQKSVEKARGWAHAETENDSQALAYWEARAHEFWVTEASVCRYRGYEFGDYYRGFVEGALHVWNEVKDQVTPPDPR